MQMHKCLRFFFFKTFPKLVLIVLQAIIIETTHTRSQNSQKLRNLFLYLYAIN